VLHERRRESATDRPCHNAIFVNVQFPIDVFRHEFPALLQCFCREDVWQLLLDQFFDVGVATLGHLRTHAILAHGNDAVHQIFRKGEQLGLQHGVRNKEEATHEQ
jgi:hypothetical protein